MLKGMADPHFRNQKDLKKKSGDPHPVKRIYF